VGNLWFRLPSLRRLLAAVLVSYLLFGLGMFLFQRQFMYFPDGSVAQPATYYLDGFTRVPLVSADGTSIAVWVHPPRAGMDTIIYFHGNAGHLGYRAEKFRAFAEAGFGLVAVSYRGYGGSEGQPTETGLYDDAATALHHALDTLRIPERNIILYGESLGTGIATHLATSHPQIALLVLEAPYRSVEDRAQELYPYLPVHYLIKDRYPQAALMAKVRSPVLIFHGTDDVIIPIQHGRDVYAAAHAPKYLVVYEGKGHTDFDPAALIAEIKKSLTHE
jgi:pimeloyl-ACP methyl ester carboxylesterase